MRPHINLACSYADIDQSTRTAMAAMGFTLLLMPIITRYAAGNDDQRYRNALLYWISPVNAVDEGLLNTAGATSNARMRLIVPLLRQW